MLNWTFTRSNQLTDLSGPDGTSLTTTPPEPMPQPKKPRIAIALGGGAARGWAHIGVLRALDEEGIEIGMIAGTSIGALVGGCYLAGKLDELESFARSLTVRRIAGLLDFAIGGGGLFGGLRLTKRMQEHLQDLSIEALDRPFVAVATEVHSGHEVWLEKGALITAIRASYALPGIFEPINANGRTLMDGALVNPVPVSVCRAHEQQLVVAVNLNYDLYGRSAVVKHNAGIETPDEPAKANGHHSARLGMTSAMVQAFNIIQDRISRARLAGDPPDLALHPKLNDIGLSEFHRAGKAIDRGYQEAKARLTEIQRMQEALIR
ncbi:patatin-like phospholipase family protein [Sinorhizobium alkalisoli]|uniref:patatin-like phospholipase family protein n=1 Tax=Sinorhizobium alkalisoli TaxID=1752398 RepID=UPI00124E9DD7|nr:patatin-like phospholipase family protein [Sinorhizobium alkalisoli]QFI66065.1 hypothetical protein EKH55_1191 [Sinorhizobium alkalisoli]